MNVVEIFNDVCDTIGTDQNGDLSYGKFNRFSRRAELRIIDWLTGNDTIIPAPPFQKNKDWLSTFIKQLPAQVLAGKITKPADYYTYDNSYRLGNKLEADCDDEETTSSNGCNTPMEIMDGQQFYVRCNTYIDEKKPSFKKPIAKIVGNFFEVLPTDLGSAVIEYVRVPIFAEIKTTFDSVFNEDVPNETTSIPYEWPESCRELLVWFIVNSFSDYTREQALKQFNAASKP